MKPVSTKFTLVQPGGAFNKLYALARKVGEPLKAGTLNFPTVAAERDGRVIGFLSTLPVDGAVVAGPLVLEKAPNALLALRLGEAYEVVMRAAGVKFYYILADKNRVDYMEQLERVGYQRAGDNGTEISFRKDLT
jgi:hypothetical protein